MGPVSVAPRMALLVALLAALQAATQATSDPPHKKFAGDAACLSCHRDQGTSYLHTSHHLTSQPANKDSILGSFHEGSNVLMIADPATATDNPGLYFKMEAKPNGFYQTAVAGWPGQLKTRTERMDVVIGSGAKILGPWLDLGFANFYTTRKPLNDFKDLDGLKIRTSGGAGQFARVKFFNGIGNMTPWPDVPLALSQGTFDAVVTTNESVASAKLWDSGLKYALEDHQFMGYYVPMVSLVFWQKLSADQQKLMVDLWAENIPTYRKNMADAQARARGELIEHGIKFTVPAPEQIAAIRKTMLAGQDEVAKELKLSPELVKAATSAMEKVGS